MTSEELKDDHIRGEILAGQEEEAEEEEEENDNFLRMAKCPRFRNCSIAKCPLDEDMDLRIVMLCFMFMLGAAFVFCIWLILAIIWF